MLQGPKAVVQSLVTQAGSGFPGSQGKRGRSCRKVVEVVEETGVRGGA